MAGSSQSYLSTRGEDDGLSFETVVLKGLAADGGLFLPEEIPLAADWHSWSDLPYAELAFRILSLYISTDEIPANDLKDILKRSYSKFRADHVTPLKHLSNDLWLLELFHGPSYSFKDCALQFLGNLFEYFLVRKNQGKQGRDRHHLTVVGATSGDVLLPSVPTGSAAICGLRGKKDVSVFILHPKGRISPLQEKQMTTVLDANVHNIAVNGTFDDCQDMVKALFADKETNERLKLGAVNSINWARILAQIVYYYHAYFSLVKSSSSFKLGDKVRAVVPTGNFGDILAGYFAKRMGLPIEKLVIATNENDILHRFWKTGRYDKKGTDGQTGGVRETLSPAMDILVSSNFERLLWYLAFEFASTAGMDQQWSRTQASREVTAWLADLKNKGGFGPVYADVLESARRTFESERVTDSETVQTIQKYYRDVDYVLDPHTAVGITAAERSMARTAAMGLPHISLSTAHPAKFAGAVNMALEAEPGFDFSRVLPAELAALVDMETRVSTVDASWQGLRELLTKQVEDDLRE
ncbi:hypothetical protein L249_2563 [Ophiocordyceps polyrhachis-furcata BCC 54312]|uniref:Threonine synthase n=1 Tax=Ophiocordyceps polyrhachis-furcata BCC 54312 TaxID=1330021 RepID=A0A367LN34_9HYPO|nr:hypothetical protein L249_2563 [Ophiocordyceps polyrhachis-furcata BCC 54312]